MKAINKFFIALFCFVIAGVCSIAGVLINSVAQNTGLLSGDLTQKLNWFSAHLQTSTIIVWVLWGGAGLLALTGIIAVARIIGDKRTTADTDLGVDYKRLED